MQYIYKSRNLFARFGIFFTLASLEFFIGYSQSEAFSIQLHFGFGELKWCK